MDLIHANLTVEEYRHIIEPYILDRLQHGFTDQSHEINIKRFASLYGYPYDRAQKHLGKLIRSLSNKVTPGLLKLPKEGAKTWILSYSHNIDMHTYEITFSNQLSKLLFNVFKKEFVNPNFKLTSIAS